MSFWNRNSSNQVEGFQGPKDLGGVNQRSAAAWVCPGQRMERSTKINTYIYNEINTGPIGTFVGVLLAALAKTTVVPHLKQYYSLTFCESCAYVGAVFLFCFLLWCQNNWEWKTLRCFIYMTIYPFRVLFFLRLIYKAWVHSFVINFSRGA